MNAALLRIFAACLTCSGITVAGHALAVEVPAVVARPSLPGAEVVVVGDFPNADAVGPRVTSWFQGQAITASASRRSSLAAEAVFAPSESAGVRVWVLLPAAARARLFFSVQERVGGEPRFLVQDVELSSGFDELGLELVAQVAYLSAVALWEGNAASSRQDVEKSFEAPPVASPLPAQPLVAPDGAVERGPSQRKPNSRWVAHGVATFEARFQGPEGAFLGPLLGLQIGRFNGADVEWTFGGGVRWFLDPHEVRAQGVTLDFLALCYGVTLGHTRRLGGPFWFSAELGPELEQVHYRVKSLQDPRLSDKSPGGYTLRPGVFGSLALGWKVHPLLMITLAATVGMPLVRAHYDIADSELPGGREKLIEPWAAQPGFSLGVRYF